MVAGVVGRERDGPPHADLRDLGPVRLAQGLPCRVEGRSLGGQGEGLRRRPCLHVNLGAPRDRSLQVPDQGGRGPLGVLSRCDPQAHPGPGHGDQLVRGFPDGRSIDAHHGHRGLRPHALADHALADEPHPGEHPRGAPELVLADVHIWSLAGDQAVDGDVAVLVVKRGQRPGQHGQGIGGRAAVHPAVHGVVQHPDLDHAVDHASQRRGDGGLSHAAVPGVRHDQHVRRQQVAVSRHELREMLGAGLLFALDQELHGDGGFALVGPEGGRVGDHAGLVVRGSSAVQAPVPLGGFERGTVPQVVPAGRLHVVVRVQEDGGALP